MVPVANAEENPGCVWQNQEGGVAVSESAGQGGSGTENNTLWITRRGLIALKKKGNT